jgi:hypothetical protein
MEQVKNLTHETKAKNLIERMRGEGKIEVILPEITEKMGRAFAIACDKNEKELLIQRAKLMKDASRPIFFD